MRMGDMGYFFSALDSLSTSFSLSVRFDTSVLPKYMLLVGASLQIEHQICICAIIDVAPYTRGHGLFKSYTCPRSASRFVHSLPLYNAFQNANYAVYANAHIGTYTQAPAVCAC